MFTKVTGYLISLSCTLGGIGPIPIIAQSRNLNADYCRFSPKWKSGQENIARSERGKLSEDSWRIGNICYRARGVNQIHNAERHRRITDRSKDTKIILSEFDCLRRHRLGFYNRPFQGGSCCRSDAKIVEPAAAAEVEHIQLSIANVRSGNPDGNDRVECLFWCNYIRLDSLRSSESDDLGDIGVVIPRAAGSESRCIIKKELCDGR